MALKYEESLVTNGNKGNNNITTASLTVRRHQSRLPRSEYERSLPLQQLKDIKIYNIENIIKRANLATQSRLTKLIQQLQRPFDQKKSGAVFEEVPRSAECRREHCEMFLQHGIYKRISEQEEQQRPTLGALRVFTVVELEKQRLRTIHWPQDQNDEVYKNGYTAHMPELCHVSNFLPAVFTECAAVGDISASFYGVEIDDIARQHYRFRDSEGNLYEMCRMMMGHVLAAEIQHIITCVICGHRDYTQPQYQHPFQQQIRCDIWIDNVRYYGPRQAVTAAVQQLRTVSNTVNAAMTVADPTATYDFIGVNFDHSKQSVCLASKTSKKILQNVPGKIRADDLEGLVGRLIFASAVLQRPLINRWWTLKWARRVFNQLNRGLKTAASIIDVNDSVRRALNQWINEARSSHNVVRRNSSKRRATLFTDATLEGWGAVLITQENEVFVAGGRFPATHPEYGNNIAPHEAWAVDLALNAFSEHVKVLAELDLFVDNTSVKHGIARAQVKAESLVNPVRNIISKIIDNRISLFVDYVNTKMNPADSISRGERLEVHKVQLAMKANNSINKRKGAVVGRLVS